MSKYQRIVDRIMTPEEAAAKCTETGLDQLCPRAVGHIVGLFAHFQEYAEDERVVRSGGRLGFGQQWEGQKEELARALGLGAEEAHAALYSAPVPLVDTVWADFFAE